MPYQIPVRPHCNGTYRRPVTPAGPVQEIGATTARITEYTTTRMILGAEWDQLCAPPAKTRINAKCATYERRKKRPNPGDCTRGQQFSVSTCSMYFLLLVQTWVDPSSPPRVRVQIKHAHQKASKAIRHMLNYH